MEKGRSVTTPAASRRSLSFVKTFIAACVLTGGLFYFARPVVDIDRGNSGHRPSAGKSEVFRWSKLAPSKNLKWEPCYNGHECARLEVPLDYNDHSVGNAAIALLRIPATEKGDNYKGPILFNPGGPGGSGVDMILNMGFLFQSILGNDYDIVGFDPRGIGYTTPVVDVFQDPLERAAWGIRHADAPFVNETSTALAQAVTRSKLMSILIEERSKVAAQYVNTAVVSRDLLSIMNAHGLDKLQYWGFSYGSVLGSTFASLFPNNVGRLVIDGVVDADNYYKADLDNNLERADAGLDLVFEQCAASGKECALYEPTADAVRARYLRLVKVISDNPVIVHVGGVSAIISRKQVRGGLLRALYNPYVLMKSTFEAFRALEHGNGLPLYVLTEAPTLPALECDCSDTPPPPIGGQEGGISVLCSDGLPVADDPAELYSHYEKLAKQSYFGDIWSEMRMLCVGWKVKPKWEWRGPVTGNTSFPLLLVGNTEDPVTPHAKKMSKRFKNSVVLMQNSAGHCTLSATSFCTAKAIRDYFREGILPAKGTVCEIESHMFLNHTGVPTIVTSEEDAKVLEAWRALKSRLPFAPFLHRY